RLPRYFKNLDEAGTPFVDEHGALWMEIQESGRAFKVGLSANNILAPGSDSLGAYELLLVRTDRILKSPKHSRESMLEFRLDWVMLQRASEKNALSLARNAIPGKSGHGMFVSGSGDDWDGLDSWQRAVSGPWHVNLFTDCVTRWRYPVLRGAIPGTSTESRNP